MRLDAFHGEDQKYIILLAFLFSYVRSYGITNTLLSVILTFTILVASIWYNLESFNFSFERLSSIQREDAISAAPYFTVSGLQTKEETQVMRYNITRLYIAYFGLASYEMKFIYEVQYLSALYSLI